METVIALAQPREESVPQVPSTTPDASRTLAVAATYLLTEEGRKASLLAGGDGHAVQQLTVHVSANRLHLVSVDANGIARLKLRPRFRLNREEHVIRDDSAPTYDAPPDIEDLFREAARNHQLERAHQAERHATKIKRREVYQERRTAIAQAFLTDPARRALVHPTPTTRRCYVDTEHGRVVFDANTDVGPARDVPAEGHRRFRADQRARRDRIKQVRMAHLALHEEKKQVLAAWIAAQGTPDQQARYAAGLLPIEEAIEAMADQTFAALADRPRYIPDGPVRLQAYLRRRSQYSAVLIAREDVVVTSANAESLTAEQWAVINEFRALLPEATIVLRVHKVRWKHDTELGLPPMFGILVTQRVGPFTVRREYAHAIGHV